jgi:transposase InsO family protein
MVHNRPHARGQATVNRKRIHRIMRKNHLMLFKTFEGWLYMAVAIDLFSRAVIGWSMQSRIDRELITSVLLMAISR